ncbi:MAG: PD-(D/E)XK nuclease family protein [Phycisphaerae bacterium]|nr:PD-(D/E)XK nuclease family protein [Phycisphaerae bacterium]
MPVTFILGRGGVGKTHRCLDEILTELTGGCSGRPPCQPSHRLEAGATQECSNHNRRLVLLVPEQASFQMERALAIHAPGGGYTRAEVLSFSRLARRVFDETGTEPDVISPQARALALRSIVAHSSETLQVLRTAARTAGFYVELDRLIEELLREDVSPETLHAVVDRLDDSTIAPDGRHGGRPLHSRVAPASSRWDGRHGGRPLHSRVAPASSRWDGRHGGRPLHSCRKLKEVARLYEEYLKWLGPDRTDAAARLAVLRERLEGLDWLREASVWVDGFAGFTGQELATLVGLTRVARDATITLLLDPAAPAVQHPRQIPDPLGLFQSTEVTYQQLLRLFEDAGVEVKPSVDLQPSVLPRFADAPTLAALEAGLATPIGLGEGVAARTTARAEARGSSGLSAQTEARGSSGLTAGDVALYEYTTHRDELRAAARWIRTRIAVADEDLHFRDFAVIARDLGPFVQTIAEVFEEYEIPYFLDRRRPMRTHPLSRFFPALFDAAASDFDVSPMVRLLRTRLLPLSRDHAEQLENVIIKNAARGSALWRQPRWAFEGAGNTNGGFQAEHARIMAALEPLLTLYDDARFGDKEEPRASARAAPRTPGWRRIAHAHLGQIGENTTGVVWAQTLHQVLESLEVRRRIETWIAEARTEHRWESAEMHRLAWEALCGLLEDLHDVLGDTLLTAEDVAGILNSGLSEQTLGLAPPTVDQVLVSSIERSRHPDIKYAWLFAFNEGIFPARPAEDTLLSTVEREALAQAGLPAQFAHREDIFGERLLAYIALTRPSRGLTISFATVADDGEALMPSPLLAEVRRALPDLPTLCLREYEPPVCLPEFARGYLAVRGDDRRMRERRRYERLCELVRTDPSQTERLGWLLRGLEYRNEPQPVGNYRQKVGGDAAVVWDGSPSEVETYLQCPFKHFASYGLRLDPARGPQPLRWDLGDVAHAIMADVTLRARQEPGGVRAVSDERWQELLAEAVRDYWQRQPADIGERRPDFVFLGEVLTSILRDLVLAHADRWRRGRFEPLYCEKAFRGDGAEDALPAVELKLPDGRRVLLHGKIDRIDTCRSADQTLALVYDYKSSPDTVGGDYLTGRRLQIFIYLLALQHGMSKEASIQPAGVLIAPLYPGLKMLDNQYAAEAPEHEQLMYLYRPRGLFSADAARLLDEQHSHGHSPAAQMQRKKDGGYYKNSDVVDAGEIERRLNLARQTVLFAAEGVSQGRIEVAPLVEKRILACRLCEFQAVCRFDRAYNRPRAAEQTLPRLSDEGAA